MLIADLTLPASRARWFAEKSDPTTASDRGYVARTVAMETFKENMRTFRVYENGDKMKIVGLVRGNEIVRPRSVAVDSLKHNIEFIPFEVNEGDEIWLEVLACPLKSVGGRRNDKDGANEKRRRTIDVAESRNYNGRPAAYNAWLQHLLKDPDSGCLPMSVARFRHVEPFQVLRKRHKGPVPTHSFKAPMFDGSIKVKVLDVAKFEAFLFRGIGRMRAFGFGAMIPKEALNEILQ